MTAMNHDCGRGEGKTQFLIDALCDAIAEGQPKARVWAHSMQFAIEHLQPRVVEGLKQRGLTIDKVARGRIEVEGSVIVFHCASDGAKMTNGARGFGEFVDHSADQDGELLRSLGYVKIDKWYL